MEEGKVLQSSFFLEDGFNYNNNFLTDNLLPLPSSSSSQLPPLHYYNQLVPPPQPTDDSTQQQQQLFDFLPNSTHHLHNFTTIRSPYSPLHQLTKSSSSSSSFSPCPKRPRSDSLLQSVSPSVTVQKQKQRETARQRRQSIGDKVRCVQKLLPHEGKMDIATTLEEAHKYVLFLQAQVKALNAMPVESSFAVQKCFDSRFRFGGGHGVGLGLEMLGRQQVLQVLVNSPVAQTTLYSKGLCVFSLEQLILMNKVAHAKLFLQHYFSST